MDVRASWRGHLRLALVTCPVALVNAIGDEDEPRFHWMNPATGARVRTILVDEETGEPVERRDLVRGYEAGDGGLVAITSEELGSIRLESGRILDIDRFVPAGGVDDLFLDHPYFVKPAGEGAAEPFAVIRAAMERSGQVAIGRFTLNRRERLVALAPHAESEGLIATTLRSRAEVRAAQAVYADVAEDLASVRLDADMLAIARALVTRRTGVFDPTDFVDRHREALKALIEAKRTGRPVEAAPRPAEPTMGDLLESLRASLTLEGANDPGAAAPGPRPGPTAPPATPKRRGSGR